MTNEPVETFRITGMDCADCAKTIEAGVAKLDGVSACSLNYGAAKLNVTGAASREDVVARVRALGYDVRDSAQPAGEDARPQTNPVTQRLTKSRHSVLNFAGFLLSRRETALAALGAVLVLPSVLLVEIAPFFTGQHVESPLLNALSLAALLCAGLPVARSAWRTLTINRQISINLLMTIAAVGAVVIGAYTEAGLVMVLFAIGEALEGFSMDRARNSIHSLMDVAPSEATVLRACVDCQEHLGQDGYAAGPCPFCGLEETRVFVDELRVGETIVVRPGERIAMDGCVLKGASSVNQAPITGESVPVEKTVGADVFAGTVNGEGALEVEVTRIAQDNTISRIVHMVEEAQEKKAPVERFVDQFAKYYTPAVIVVAGLVAFVPPLLFGAAFWGTQGWLYRGLELLVVACPCALVISTPVALVSAISNAARNGVLVKGGVYLETLSRVKAIAFDKTGTLTEGAPSVVKLRAADCLNPLDICERCDDLLALASAVERRSEHPLALAIVNAADGRGVRERYGVAEGVTALIGKGVNGNVGGRNVLIGSHALFDVDVPHDAAWCAEIDDASSRGQTPVLIGQNGAYRGYIAVADTVRASAREAVQRLNDAGIATVMLTGDNAATARAIAERVGVSDVRAELMPDQKVAAIQALQAEYGGVAMVGDGINDAPSLATADVGIAMGAGTAQAIETADVALMGNDLAKLPFLFGLSRATMRNIKTNVALSIGVKFAFLAIVLLGFGTMWMAVLADVGVALLVTLNGMRLTRYAEQPRGG